MRRLIPALLACVAVSCTEGDRIIDIDDRTGMVRGTAYVDRNADGAFVQGTDVAAEGVVAALLLDATGDTVARTTTLADGTFIMAGVPIGRYRLVGARGALGDTVDVQDTGINPFSLAANDTVHRQIRLGYPSVTTDAARALPVGRRVVIDGIALNAWTTFGDSTVHIRDAAGSIRAVRVQQVAVQAGDSVRLLGVTGVVGTSPVIADATVRILSAAAGLPPGDSISTQEAATALGGALADGQVRIAGAIIQDTSRVGNDIILGVSDGSGRLEVVLDANIPFDAGPYAPGAAFSASGVLVPSNGAWRLKPRTREEAVVTVPTLTIAQARVAEVGLRVRIEGVSLNAWNVFGDSTVSVRDATGFMRAVRVTAPVAAGDSIRFTGVIAVRNGQPVLSGAAPTLVLGGVGTGQPDSMSTATAASASGGALDAAFVRVSGSISATQTLPGGDIVVTVNDGSGALEVVLDATLPFSAASFQPGAIMQAAGVLVPTGSAWQLKPRALADASASFPLLTIAQARVAAAGIRVLIQGISLNNWTAFGDSTVHMMDATGTMRAVRVLSPVAAGDSIRMLGTIATRNGQPVLSEITPTLMRAGVGIAEPDSISTAAAASANGGAFDARLVRVGGPIVAAQTLGNGDILVSVNDGTGLLEVVLDDSQPFQASGFQPGALLRAAGVLVPTGTGTWQLKPRSTADASATYPTVTIAEARALEAGKTVYVEGIALNGWGTFGDQTVHIRDASDVIRTIGVPNTPLLAGDSIRILGVVAMRNGQPVLNATSAAVLLAGVGLPPIDSVTTVIAAAAQGGARDADQVAVSGVISAVTNRTGGEVALTIDDGSGSLIVVLDPDVGIATGAYTVGAAVRVRGVLVPATNGTSWELKPRTTTEIALTPP